MKRESLIIFYDVGSLRRYLGLAVVRQTLDVRKFRSVSLIYAQKPRNSSLQGDPPGVQRWEPNPRCNIRTWRKTSINRAPATGQEWGESFTNLYSLTVDL